MMRIIPVKSCRECPHSTVGKLNGYGNQVWPILCQITLNPPYGINHRPIPNINEIPDWCSLLSIYDPECFGKLDEIAS
jgi:hypothetical protein